ncbi:MAG: Do family serine endopeptidase, partial [Acidobacteriaceae bacterium]|nr:Do family serine endopeptidase [Acidobacteriaceae bacterium]
MNRSFQMRRTTALLTLVIAALVGALIATVGITHQTPVRFETAHAAALSEQAPFGTFAPVVKHAMPAVVNISSSKTVKTSGQMPGMFDDPMFRQFFGGRVPRMQPRSERSTSLGSGVVVSKDGYILTNNHVVEGATDVKVSFADKREYPAKIIGADKYADIAVIKIDQQDLPTLAFASAPPQVGDVTLAIGNPFGLGGTVTMGIVSATGRTGLGIERYEDFIQTDAAINPGNSGGALVNAHGDLIGINTAILAGNSGGNQGIGFAIPVNLAHNIMDQLVKNGKVSRGYIGVTLQNVDPELAKSFGLQGNVRGIAITSVTPNSPGAKAGLQTGDVITAVNGTPVEERGALQVMIAGMAPGTTANLKVFRSGNYKDFSVTLSEFPKNLLAGAGDQDQDDQNPLNGSGEKGAMKGVSVQAITPDIRQQLQLPDN